MALSATAMGKIRLAAAAGKAIPADWAMAADGSPTTDPNEAIKGMLAPAAGPKGSLAADNWVLIRAAKRVFTRP